MSWTNFIKGAAAYVMLETRPVAEQESCLAACAACPNMRVFEEDEVGAVVRWAVGTPRAMWCGHPGTPDSFKKTCGCCVGGEASRNEKPVVTISVKGQPIPMRPAWKTEKRSACPLGKF